ncbi:MAG: ABC transporter substrate-binding protein [Anaerolineae bacterium]
MFSGKRLLVFLVLALAMLSLTAAVPAAAQDGSTLTWSIEGINDLPSLDPAKASDSQGFTVIGLIYGGLVRLDGDLLVVPDLAESWTVSDDGLTYTFTLRSDAKFSDGSAITADDVIWSLVHALDPNTGGWTGSYYLYNIVGAQDVIDGKTLELSGASAPDEHTVVLQVNQPSAYFLSQLTFGSAKIVSKAAAEADPTGWEAAPVSSGPFQVQEWNHGQNIILAPNPNYWQVPQISTLTMPFIQDSETAYQLYRTGELDIMGSQQNGVPSVHIPEVQTLSDFRQAASFVVRYVGFNNVIAPFNDMHACAAPSRWRLTRTRWRIRCWAGRSCRPTVSYRWGFRLRNCRSPGCTSTSTPPKPNWKQQDVTPGFHRHDQADLRRRRRQRARSDGASVDVEREPGHRRAA